MPPYETMHWERVLLMVGFGVLITAAVILARGSRYLSFTCAKKSDAQHAEEVHRFPDGLEETNRPVPLLIWLVFFGYFLWAAAYMVYAGHVGV
jgi:RsiW-degrading membrane proteinase PrsW (M82 family)